MKQDNWPSFLIIGAGKSGTTSLYRYLAEHPQVFMSQKKEPNFFAFEGKTLDFNGPGDNAAKNTSITTPEKYLQLFADVTNEKAIGEASPVYIFSEGAAERIHHYIPDVKLVAILRHPVDRAYSAFMMMVRNDREPCHDFKKVVQDLKRRQRENWGSASLLEEGFYFKTLSRYYKIFDKAQIKVFLFEDIIDDVSGVYSDLCKFIGVDNNIAPRNFVRHNISGKPRIRFLHNWISKAGGVGALGKLFLPKPIRASVKEAINDMNLARVPIDPTLRQELISMYRDDIVNLQKLIDRDLSHWLE